MVKAKDIYLIGIAGPSCTGKSSLCELVAKEYKNVTHIKLDDFFKDIDEFSIYMKWRNWDVPINLKFDELYDALIKLKNGKKTIIPIYSRKIGKMIGKRMVKPTKIIVVEGFLLFHNERIRKLFNLKVFLRISEKRQLARRIKRQKDFDTEYFHQVIIPMYKKYGEDNLVYADYVLNADKSLKYVKKDFDKILSKNLPMSIAHSKR
jgi:uridine kinase